MINLEKIVSVHNDSRFWVELKCFNLSHEIVTSRVDLIFQLHPAVLQVMPSFGYVLSPEILYSVVIGWFSASSVGAIWRCFPYCTVVVVLMVGICASTIYFPPSLNIVWGNLLCITSLPSISDIHLTAGKIFAVCRRNTIIHFESVYIMRQLIILHLLVLSLWWITINFVMSVSMSEMEPVPK